MGHHVITCDYLPTNPGHRFAHEYFNVSTTDHQAVLKVAQSRSVDGVLAYASDPAAPTAAYVASELGLPGCSPAAIHRLTDKVAFREHQRNHGFAAPDYVGVTDLPSARAVAEAIGYPVMVKPCNSSGSKGVARVMYPQQLPEAFDYAAAFAPTRRIRVERWIARCGEQIAGDGLVHRGHVAFLGLGDEHFDSDCCGWAPVGETFPGSLEAAQRERLVDELDGLFESLGIVELVFNLDAMIDREGRLQIIEIGPRAGGNFLPQVIEAHTGVDLTSVSIRLALGEPIDPACYLARPRGCFASWVLHAREDGYLSGYQIDRDIEPCIRELCVWVDPGTLVRKFASSRDAIGCALLEFPDKQTMNAQFARMNELLKVVAQ
jgi:biotin carboxylase